MACKISDSETIEGEKEITPKGKFPTNKELLIVRKALGRVLPNYEIETFKSVEQGEDCDHEEVMEVKKDKSVRVYPSSDKKYLSYGKDDSGFALHVASEKGDKKKKKFMYQWEDYYGAQYVSSPFVDNNPSEGQVVPCSPGDITAALKEKDPIEAVVRVLRTLKSNRVVGDNGLDGPDFIWKQKGKDGNFRVHIPDESYYWRDIDDSKVGNSPDPGLVLTTHSSHQLHLRLKDV